MRSQQVNAADLSAGVPYEKAEPRGAPAPLWRFAVASERRQTIWSENCPPRAVTVRRASAQPLSPVTAGVSASTSGPVGWKKKKPTTASTITAIAATIMFCVSIGVLLTRCRVTIPDATRRRMSRNMWYSRISSIFGQSGRVTEPAERRGISTAIGAGRAVHCPIAVLTVS